MAEPVSVTMVNHVGIDIAASPGTVWRAILEDYVEARKFRDSGAITPFDDPAAIFGGYRMRLEQNGVVDERIVRITERDELNRRLSATADYLSVPGGLRVYATYHARNAADGSHYVIDCHTQLTIEAPSDGSKAEIARTLGEMAAGADAHLLAYLATVKARVEGSA